MCGFLKAREYLKSYASVWGFPKRCQGVCLDEDVLTTGERAWGCWKPTILGTPLPSHSPMLTWGEGARGDRGSHEVSGGDKSWGQKYTESWRGGGGQGEPPNTASLLGVGETPGSLLPLWCFPGEGSSEMGQRPETSNMEGASEVAGVGGEDEGREEGEGWGGRGTCVRRGTQVVGEERWRKGNSWGRWGTSQEEGS